MISGIWSDLSVFVEKSAEECFFVVAPCVEMVHFFLNKPATLPVRSAHQGGCFIFGGCWA